MLAFIFLCLLSSSKIAENDKMRVYQFGSFRGNQNIYFENQDNIRAKVIQNANPNEKPSFFSISKPPSDRPNDSLLVISVPMSPEVSTCV